MKKNKVSRLKIKLTKATKVEEQSQQDCNRRKARKTIVDCKTFKSTKVFRMNLAKLTLAKMKADKGSVSVVISIWLLVSVSGAMAESRPQNFLPTENSNLEVLKELGVDIQHEGRTLRHFKPLLL